MLIIDILIVLIIIYFLYSYPHCTRNVCDKHIDLFQNEKIEDISKMEKTEKMENPKTLEKPTLVENTNNSKPENYKIPEVEKNIKSKDINLQYKKYSNGILDNIKKNQNLLNDRYRLQKIHYYDKDLHNEMLANEFLNELETNALNSNNVDVLIIDTDNDIDNKILNKSNRCQKLFKDSKTIAARFNKNSMVDNYAPELDYYEQSRTPWWAENMDLD
jgi:hypothetical protein